MATPGAALLSIKLFVPPVRRDRVARARLLARLDEILRPGARLMLISAPAGFGKTSLLAEWITARGLAAGWVSLDSGDNDPGQFLAYLAAAIERARPGTTPETQALLRGQPPASPNTVLPVLINELSSLDPAHPLLLALDDIQFISAVAARETLQTLVEHLPPGLRIAIATRADPPLPLPRLRARGQMVELRAADLRFTPSETVEFLAQVGGLPAGGEEMQLLSTALAARTEGWAAGLQMAVLALQGLARPSGAAGPTREEIAAFARTFSGSNRFVLDYLVEEVLERLPEGTVDFLLKTALLDRFSAGLCAAVMAGGERPGPETEEAYRALLAELDAANLFLVPLDNERRWFRYHHLFADLLRARFNQAYPGQAGALHGRASAWFESEGWIVDAIRHALAAEDWERAARLVEEHTVALLARGELHNLVHWLQLLPAETAARRPWLCVCRAWARNFSGDMAQAEEALKQAEANLQAVTGEAERRVLEGHIAVIRCQRAVVLGDGEVVYRNAALAQERLPANGWAYSVADWSLAYVSRAQGDLEKAAVLFRRVLEGDTARANPWGIAMNATDLGIVLRLQGHLRESLRVHQEALEWLEAHQARRNGYVGRLLTALAAGQYERNELNAARRSLEEARDLNEHWHNPNHAVFAFSNLARVLTAQGDYAGALAVLEEAEATARGLPVVATLGQAAAMGRIRVLLAQGLLPSAGSPVEELVQAMARAAQDTGRPAAFSESREQAALLAARVLLAQDRADEAHRVLAPVEESARAFGRGGVMVEILGLKALVARRLGRAEAAKLALLEALSLAQPEGYLRPLLDLAPLRPGALTALLAGAAAAAPQYRAFCDTLLAALPPAEAPAAPRPSPAQSLVEPLTEREIEVLRLLAEGLTNAQVAERLVISIGTVKAHTAAIFRKLDVANRTQAVARARELTLLP